MNLIEESSRRAQGSWRSRFDMRTGMVIASASGAVPLLAIAMASPTFLRPNAFPVLIAVLVFTAVTVAFAVRVGRLSESQFAALGFGGMAGVAVSAYLIADPAGTRAVTSMLATVPAIAASGSPPRVTAALTAISVAMATVLSIVSLSSVGWAVTAIATGAAATTVLVPVALIGGLRRTLLVVNRKLSVLADTDPLTGLANRRGLLAHAHTLVHGVSQRAEQLSALVIDIDYFKNVNDTAGHTAGDRALTAVADTLTRAVADNDGGGDGRGGASHFVVARIGGEEFLILAAHRGDHVLAQQVLAWIRSDCTVTVSIGSVTLDVQHCDLTSSAHGRHCVDGTAASAGIDQVLDTVIHAADAALYRAKTEGRDRACHAGTLDISWPNSTHGRRVDGEARKPR